ncbi:MAG TPA: hypothetical protein VK021_03480 [Flavobacteriaceae bacterium]|nr:hypothetical protein [Flavobacteriaceae bacterium]
MKFLNLILLISFFIISTSCTKDDDNDPECVKDENYFTAEFDGETLEPYWRSGLSPCKYTLNIGRNPQDQNDWVLRIGIENPDININMYIKDINGVGSYPIETGAESELPIRFSKTHIYIIDESYGNDPNLSIYNYFSMGDTGSVEITTYDDESGILVGAFSCTMYSTHNGEEKEISGEFNINLSTLDTCQRPCWL